MKLQKIIKELEERSPETEIPQMEIPLHYSEEQVIIALEMCAKSLLQEIQDIKKSQKIGSVRSKYSGSERLIELSNWLRSIGNDLYRWTNRYVHGDYPSQLTK